MLGRSPHCAVWCRWQSETAVTAPAVCLAAIAVACLLAGTSGVDEAVPPKSIAPKRRLLQNLCDIGLMLGLCFSEAELLTTSR